MSYPAPRLAEHRANRDAARGVFEANLKQIRTDLEARGIGGRIADKTGKEAKAVLDEALDIAAENKGIVAGTIAALLLWLLRNPIVEAVTELFGEEEDATGGVQPDLLSGGEDASLEGARTSD